MDIKISAGEQPPADFPIDEVAAAFGITGQGVATASLKSEVRIYDDEVLKIMPSSVEAADVARGIRASNLAGEVLRRYECHTPN